MFTLSISYMEEKVKKSKYKNLDRILSPSLCYVAGSGTS